jgi:predicted transcriptional regulator
MNETDDAILEYFEELDTDSEVSIALPPTAVWYNLTVEMSVLDRSQNTISRRMNKLAEIGLLSKVDEQRGYYSLTEKGRAYLSGELDADDLENESE